MRVLTVMAVRLSARLPGRKNDGRRHMVVGFVARRRHHEIHRIKLMPVVVLCDDVGEQAPAHGPGDKYDSSVRGPERLSVAHGI